MGRDVIVACDFSGRKETLEFLGELEGLNPFIKIGMELFYREGPQMVRELKEKGTEYFSTSSFTTYPILWKRP